MLVVSRLYYVPRARLVAGPSKSKGSSRPFYDLQSEGGPAQAHHDDLVAHADHARNPAPDVRRDGVLLILPDPARAGGAAKRSPRAPSSPARAPCGRWSWGKLASGSARRQMLSQARRAYSSSTSIWPYRIVSPQSNSGLFAPWSAQCAARRLRRQPASTNRFAGDVSKRAFVRHCEQTGVQDGTADAR
jgi:hypothetical protein